MKEQINRIIYLFQEITRMQYDINNLSMTLQEAIEHCKTESIYDTRHFDTIIDIISAKNITLERMLADLGDNIIRLR